MMAIGDVTLFVRQLGETQPDRPSLLVLHGGPDVGHSYLLPGLQPLAEDRHVVAFDFRGCGRSSRGLPDEALQPEHVIGDAHQLIARLDLEQVDLLGFSTGGRAALEFLRRFPHQVRRVVLASTSAYPASDAQEHLKEWEEFARRQWMEEAAGGALRGSTMAVWNLEMAPKYLAMIKNLDVGDWRYERWLAGEMHPWVNGDPEKILSTFEGRILILHGEMDMVFPLQLAKRLHGAVPASELAIIADVGHMSHFEEPLRWAGRIRSFLDRC